MFLYVSVEMERKREEKLSSILMHERRCSIMVLYLVQEDLDSSPDFATYFSINLGQVLASVSFISLPAWE